ncbi:MAG: sugar ABC transporter permease [Rhizobiales bacterium]|nr:sugar ABC transporter permease [Hyphomicrobiales bacterium]MBI3673459.1 sugar ABC transporter permease [Hyphomicrobiales bacterium]
MTAAGSHNPAMSDEGMVKRFLRATEIDARMLGMIGALLVIWAGFDIYSGFLRQADGLFGGSFLTPRNIWILMVQTSSIGVMTTGMVLVIVMRQIDLSVGSMLSLVGVSVGYLQVYKLGPWLGVGHPSIWIIAVLFALALGALIGFLNGTLIAYLQIPSFIVTLGGLIAYSGLAWWVIRGETVAPMDQTYKLIGGNGPLASIGPLWSWVLAIVACAGIVAAIINGRTQRRRFNFPLRPIWAETVLAVVGSVVVLLFTWVVNSYPWAPKVIEKYAIDHDIPIPPGALNVDGNAICMADGKVVRCLDGLSYETGYAIPVLIMLAVGFVMTFMATRTRFGRYIYATGGNPEAAELAGINTRRLTVMVFTLMGILVAISAMISTARLDSATNSLGQFNELYVIAAAVIGGTSLAGGIGTIYGAVLGALLMQSLQSGMTLLNFESAYKDMVVGAVLVSAVFLDQVYRRRVK